MAVIRVENGWEYGILLTSNMKLSQGEKYMSHYEGYESTRREVRELSKGDRKTPVTCSLPPALVKELDSICNEEMLSRSEMVAIAIQTLINLMDQRKPAM